MMERDIGKKAVPVPSPSRTRTRLALTFGFASHFRWSYL